MTAFRTRVREILEPVGPASEALDLGGHLDEEVFRTLGASGVFRDCAAPPGRGVPVEPWRFLTLVEELARTGCMGLTQTVAIHVGVFIPYLARFGGPEVEEILEEASSGRGVGTLAVTEPTPAGSDLLGMTTTWDPGTGRVTGNKRYVTQAVRASWAVMVARHTPGRHFANLATLVVSLASPGVTRVPLAMAVFRAAGIGALELDHAPVVGPPLGRRELTVRHLQEHLAIERLAAGAWASALAERALADARAHARGRRLGEATLWENAAVRQSFGMAVARTSLVRALTERLGLDVERTGLADGVRAAALQAEVGPLLDEVFGTCLQFEGARGLEADSRLLKLLAEARVFRTAGGTRESMLDLLAARWEPS